MAAAAVVLTAGSPRTAAAGGRLQSLGAGAVGGAGPGGVTARSRRGTVTGPAPLNPSGGGGASADARASDGHGSEFPAEIVTLPLATERLMLDGVRHIEYWSLVWRGLARLDRVLEQVPGADMRAYNLELGDDENLILSLLTSSSSRWRCT